MRKPFYGWIIVGVTFLIGFTEAGVFQNILSVFLKPMAAEFGWSRSLITGAIAFGSVCGGIASPFFGPVLDKHGPRMIAFWGVLILSAGLVTLAFLTQPWQLYIFFGVGRMIAVGILGMAIAVTISNWFVRLRGRAMGIAQLGSRVGTAIFPPFVQFIIVSFGWRLAWGVLGMVVFCLSAIPSLIFLKRRPEDIGLLPDGEIQQDKDIIRSSDLLSTVDEAWDDSQEQTWTREQALRSPSFWIINLMSCMILFSGAGINFHIFPFMTDRGLSPALAVSMLSVIAVSSAFGGLMLGTLADRIPAKVLLSGVVLVLGLLFLSIFWAVKGWTVVLFSIIFGLLRGGMMPLLPLLWADYFGRTSLGTIFSLSSPIRLTANALGPIFGAVCYDTMGSYIVPFGIFALLFVLSAFTGSFIKSPKAD